MKKNKQKQQINLFMIFFVIIFLGGLLILKTSYQSLNTKSVSNKTQLLNKEYRSNFLKFKLFYPSDYTLEDGNNLIILKKGNEHIDIGRIGTNYQTINEYLEDLVITNKVQIVDRTRVMINGQEGMKAIINHPISNTPDIYSYFFYPEPWTVYTISTESNELRNDVDAIAKTFVYTP